MDTLFHFIFPIIGAMAAQVHIDHPKRNILLAAFLSSVVIDLDHYFGLVVRGSLHNIFLTVLLPLLFVFYAFHKKKNYQLKGIAIMLLLFLPAHVIMDIVFEPGVALLYPLSETYYTINPSIWVPFDTPFGKEGMVMSPLGFGVTAYFLLIIIPCYYLDRIIVFMEKKHESFRKAFKDATPF